MYHTIQSERLYEQIVDQIEQLIVSNELKVNDRLPPERVLAEQFGVSRTAVREAVKALREKGLLEVYPGRGTFVTNTTSKSMRDSLDLMLKMGRTEEELIEVREILEPEIAALAAERLGQADLDELSVALDMLDAAQDDADAFVEADLNFHLSLAKATANVILFNLIHSLVDLEREQFKRSFSVKGNAQRTRNEHHIIFKALVEGDAQSARDSMRRHLRRIRQEIKDL